MRVSCSEPSGQKTFTLHNAGHSAHLNMCVCAGQIFGENAERIWFSPKQTIKPYPSISLCCSKPGFLLLFPRGLWGSDEENNSVLWGSFIRDVYLTYCTRLWFLLTPAMEPSGACLNISHNQPACFSMSVATPAANEGQNISSNTHDVLETLPEDQQQHTWERHPKMTILSSVQTCSALFLVCNIKNVLKNIEPHWLLLFLKISCFVFHEREGSEDPTQMFTVGLSSVDHKRRRFEEDG